VAGRRALAALAPLAACGGGGGGGEDDDATPAGSGDETGEADSEPVEVDDRRLVVLSEELMLADVLEQGIRPITGTASVPEIGFQGLDGYDTEGIEVLPMTTLSLEHLASLQPDVLIALQFWVDQVGEDALDGMGEVVVVPDGLSIPDRLTFLGDELGHPDEAAQVVAELEAATERAAEAVPDDCRVSLAAIYPGPSLAAFVAGPWDLPTAVMATGCALDPDPSVAEPDENGRVYLSTEQITMLDAPTMVLLQSTVVDGEGQAMEEITATPLWSSLPAVQADRVLTFDRLGFPGARGQIRFLDELAEQLAP
jgi:ABC-type Fe3+-hydroxamate transport system substrate-binding protein